MAATALFTLPNASAESAADYFISGVYTGTEQTPNANNALIIEHKKADKFRVKLIGRANKQQHCTVFDNVTAKVNGEEVYLEGKYLKIVPDFDFISVQSKKDTAKYCAKGASVSGEYNLSSPLNSLESAQTKGKFVGSFKSYTLERDGFAGEMNVIQSAGQDPVYLVQGLSFNAGGYTLCSLSGTSSISMNKDREYLNIQGLKVYTPDHKTLVIEGNDRKVCNKGGKITGTYKINYSRIVPVYF